MRDFEFIHASVDVPQALGLAMKLGLIIRKEEPTPNPGPLIVTAAKFDSLEAGVFMLYRSEWVFGDFEFMEIDGGYNKGKFFQKPNTNYVGLTLYFGGERREGHVLRLGGGSLSRGIDWSSPSDHTVQPAPPEVKGTFDRLRKEMATGRRLRGGVHNYAVLDGAWKKLSNGLAIPLFDYIEWPRSN